MAVIINRVPAGRGGQKRFAYRGKTRKSSLKNTFLLALMLIIARDVRAQELNAQTPADPASPAIRPASEHPPLLLSALRSSSAAMPTLEPPSLVPPVSLSSSLQLEITRQLTLRDRLGIYLKSTYGPDALMGAAFDASYDQMVDDQRRWGRSAIGFGRRAASEYAPLVISNTIAFGIAAADHEDPQHSLSHQHGVWPRTRYAIVHTFVSQIDGGGRTFAFARVGGIYGAAFIANAWLPEPQAHFSSGLSRGTMNLSSAVAFNVLCEFTPDLKKLLRRL